MGARRDLVTDDVALAVDRLRHGALVAIPTETVYGLAADADDDTAVRRIYEVKGRPTDHPLIVHVAGTDRLDGWVAELTPPAARLAATCWPGPLTMLLPRGPRASDVVTAGRGTIGVRSPAHPMTHDLLARFGGGLAAPSANRFGKVSPTTAGHVLDDIGHLLRPGLDLILDGGPCSVGVESTIVDLTVEPPQILRAGAISASDVERITDGRLAPSGGPSRTSGMLAAHYQPDATIVLAESRPLAHRAANAERDAGRRVGILDRSDDVVVAAHELYADLRRADHTGLDVLVVVLPTDEGLGAALRDRLRKAAAEGRQRSSRAD